MTVISYVHLKILKTTSEKSRFFGICHRACYKFPQFKNDIFSQTACVHEVYTGETGELNYPEDGGLYETNLNCYFKIIVSEGKKVKIHFDHFDFAQGYNYGIGLSSNDNKQITKKKRPGKKGLYVKYIHH